MSATNIQKAVVFDLDGTLGSFGDLFTLWKGIRNIHPLFNNFDGLLDLYPEFLRKGIWKILQFLDKKKKSGKCAKIYLYTNNQCEPNWAHLIANYFCRKLNSLYLFDRIICAFKIGNTIVEVSRTTNKKTYSDLIKCTMLPRSAEYCFIDDNEHTQMKHDKVYYISPKPYAHSLSTDAIIERWVSSSLAKSHFLLNSSSFWVHWFNMHRTSVPDSNQDVLNDTIYHKLMFHINEFLLATSTGSSPSLRKMTRKHN
jgi:hypothetical protein